MDERKKIKRKKIITSKRRYTETKIEIK